MIYYICQRFAILKMMHILSDNEFNSLMATALDSLPAKHTSKLQNVLITFNDEPSDLQKVQLQLSRGRTLFGLFEGVPLTLRAQSSGITSGGIQKPDIITLFKIPLCLASDNEEDLAQKIKEVLWHEIAHYFGLSHEDIDKL